MNGDNVRVGKYYHFLVELRHGLEMVCLALRAATQRLVVIFRVQPSPSTVGQVIKSRTASIRRSLRVVNKQTSQIMGESSLIAIELIDYNRVRFPRETSATSKTRMNHTCVVIVVDLYNIVILCDSSIKYK